MKKTILIIIAAVAALGLGIAARQFLIPAEKSSISTLFEFNLSDLSGQPHNISEWQGKILVINFWATWCPPCLKEIPDFITLQDQYKSQGLQFIGIALDDKEAVAKYIATTQINYPVLLGGEHGIVVARQLGNNINAVPYTLIVDRQGQIIHRYPGKFPKEQLMEFIKPLLN
jgi:thiol-disulfide isomerase/thioredoxin